jgi:hypothetical protein
MSKWWLKSFVMHGRKEQALLLTRLKLKAKRQMIVVKVPSFK